METRRTLFLHPGFRDPLVAFGKELPFEHIGEALGCEPYSVAAFSDYGGDAAGLPYETFVTYVVHWNGLGPLVEKLARLKAAIAGRTMDFKGRKDRVKAARLAEWLAAFRDHPGLCIAVCFDKTGLQLPQSRVDRQTLKAELDAFGFSSRVAERLVRAASFFPVIGHLLRETDRFVWVSDHDAILEGAAGRELPTVLQALAGQVIGRKLAAFSYCKPLMPEHELVLSLPDLVAGTLASSIPHPFVSGLMSPPDEDAARILRLLADFESPHDENAQGTRLLVVTFRADLKNQLMIPRVVRLSPSGPSSAP